MNLKIVFISILVYVVCGQQAILFTSSLGFYKMRQNSNMVIIHHHLKDRGIKHENILVLLSEIATYSEKTQSSGNYHSMTATTIISLRTLNRIIINWN